MATVLPRSRRTQPRWFRIAKAQYASDAVLHRRLRPMQPLAVLQRLAPRAAGLQGPTPRMTWYASAPGEQGPIALLLLRRQAHAAPRTTALLLPRSLREPLLFSFRWAALRRVR